MPFVTLLATLVWALAGCSGGERELPENSVVSEREIDIKTVPVTFAEIGFPVRSAGTVALKKTVKLSFKLGGIIEKMLIEEGQAVRRGQMLAQLDLSEIQARVAKARSAYEKASRDLERSKNLYADKVATLEQLQNAETGLEFAASDLDVARFNLRHSVIVAPSKGKILKRFSEAGELVAPGMPVFIYASTDKNWIIRLGVIDRDVVRLELGDRAEVTFDVFGDQVFDTVVSKIAETVDAATGTFEIELTMVDLGGLRLISGFIARVVLYPGRKQRYALVPLESLVEGERLSGYVFTVDEARARAVKIPVEINRVLDGYVAISAGLENISHVVSAGAAYLESDSPVRIRGVDDPVSIGRAAGRD